MLNNQEVRIESEAPFWDVTANGPYPIGYSEPEEPYLHLNIVLFNILLDQDSISFRIDSGLGLNLFSVRLDISSYSFSAN